MRIERPYGEADVQLAMNHSSSDARHVNASHLGLPIEPVIQMTPSGHYLVSTTQETPSENLPAGSTQLIKPLLLSHSSR